VYRDEGVSGARLDRPALDRLRDAAARSADDSLVQDQATFFEMVFSRLGCVSGATRCG
jgi:hypothetical protein